MTGKRTFRLAGLEYLYMEARGPVASYAVAIADQLGRIVLRHASAAAAPSLAGQILVISKVDHLGDVLAITPVLLEVRSQTPSTRIVLLVGAWSAPLAALLKDLGLCDDYVVRSPWALNLGIPWRRRLLEDFRSWRTARYALAKLKPAAFLDLRCFTPNTLLLARQAGVPFRAGFPLRGLSYTLHASLPYSEEKAFGQQFLDALEVFGLRTSRFTGPTLGPYACKLDQVQRPAGLFSEPYIVVQPASRKAAKNAPLSSWQALLPFLAQHHPIVFLGAASDRAVVEQLLALVPAGRAMDLVGRTTIAQLFAITQHCALAVSVDSLLAHVGLATGRPTLVLKDVALTPRGFFPERQDLTLVAKDATPAELLKSASRVLSLSGTALTRTALNPEAMI